MTTRYSNNRLFFPDLYENYREREAKRKSPQNKANFPCPVKNGWIPKNSDINTQSSERKN
jgi:hypothetical protein